MAAAASVQLLVCESKASSVEREILSSTTILKKDKKILQFFYDQVRPTLNEETETEKDRDRK